MKNPDFLPTSSTSDATPSSRRECLWRIELWGGVRARFLARENSGEDALWETPRLAKVAALLAFLALERRAHRRETLVEKFWPDVEPARGANSFRVALHNLREFLEKTPELRGQILQITRETVAILPVVETDLEEFESLRERGLREQGLSENKGEMLFRALEIARGPFLAGVDEEWAPPYISRLEEQALEIARKLKDEREANGDLPGALDCARRAATLAPLRSGAMREVVRLGLLCGQSEAVQREFEAWRKGARRALGQPIPSFTQLARTLRLQGQLERRSGSPAQAPFAKSLPTSAPANRSISQTAPQSPAPTAVANAVTRALPLVKTQFWGREKERLQVQKRLREGAPLLTLCGPGGIGKTRCALECAHALQQENWAVVWLPLANLPSPRLVLGALADALGSAENPLAIKNALQTLARKGTGGRVVLLWDNCEHLSDEVAGQIEQFAESAPFVCHFVTSTPPLRLSFEEVVTLGPLREAARHLFFERANRARANLHDDEETRLVVDAICEALGGVPLAIEIAAARAPLHSPQQILDALSGDKPEAASGNPLDWLNPHRDAPQRHRTLREAIEWSARQLPLRAAQFWRQCAIFRAPFPLEAARVVAQTDDAPLHILTLRDCSLLGLDTSGVSPRAFWIESLRTFALEELSPPEKRELEARSAMYFLDLAQKWGDLLDGNEGKRAKDTLEAARAHHRAAFETFWAQADEELLNGESSDGLENALRLCAALSWFWEQKGPSLEHRQILQATLERVQPGLAALQLAFQQAPAEEVRAALSLRARAFEAAGKLATLGGEKAEGAILLQTALDLFGVVNDKGGAASCLYSLGFNALQSGDIERARELCAQSVELSRAGENWVTLGDALYNLSLVAVFAGDYGAVRELSQERLALHRKLGDARGQAVSLENLGLAALFEEQFDAALAFYEGAQKGFEKLDDIASLARCFWGAGRALVAQEQPEAAREKFEQALHLTLETHNSWALPFVWESLGYFHLSKGDAPRAAQILGAAARLREDQREPLPSPPLQWEFDGACAALQEILGAPTFAAFFEAGRHLSREEVGDLARG